MPPRTCSALRSAHQLVEAHPVNLHANSDAKTDTRNLTRLYNYPRTIPNPESTLADVAGRSLPTCNTQKLYNTVRADVSSQTKPAQGAKQHKHKLQNPLKVNKSAVGAICAPDLATEASRLIRRGQCNPASNAGSKEPIQTQQPGAQDWVGNVGGPAVSGQSLCHQVPQKLSLNGRLRDKASRNLLAPLRPSTTKGSSRYAQEEFNINGSGWNPDNYLPPPTCPGTTGASDGIFVAPTTTSQAAGRRITKTGSKNNISGTSNHNEDLGSTEEPPNPTEPGSKSWAPTACQHGQNKSLCPADLNTCKDPSNALQQRLYCCPIIAAPPHLL
ncbi:hypothetical protein RHS01_08460 [Rhizoctonia solani]|uniref:Uncharacterized protein n=1 Tax=Rhizoctonia solani TaxID=456999 RepID=A0A8H7M2C9_9AGAM|nr:hypothetical protein RHS01_08460 [Rhizoctonia solani]